MFGLTYYPWWTNQAFNFSKSIVLIWQTHSCYRSSCEINCFIQFNYSYVIFNIGCIIPKMTKSMNKDSVQRLWCRKGPCVLSCCDFRYLVILITPKVFKKRIILVAYVPFFCNCFELSVRYLNYQLTILEWILIHSCFRNCPKKIRREGISAMNKDFF